MKKTLVLVPALVTMLFVSGNSRPESASSAQEVNSAHSLPTLSAKPVDNKLLMNTMLADTTLQGRTIAILEGVGGDTPLVYIDLAEKKKEVPAEPVKDSVATADAKPAETATAEVKPALPTTTFKNYTVYGSGRDRYGKYTKECAAHANGRLKKAGIYSYGHAYQIPYHFPSVINGYHHAKLPELGKANAATILSAHREAADYVKENLDMSKLEKGKYYVVNMYYSTSSHMIEFYVAAKRQGTGNYGTHVGVLYYDQKSETWIVEHNIHGHVHFDALVSILGGKSNPYKYGVTSISRAL